jgi:two-component system sensor histidine kinase UhpB
MAERNQDLAGRLIRAQETERARIARDLHDDLSQQLATIGMMLSALERAVSTPRSEAQVADAMTTLRNCTVSVAESIRNLSHELHPGALAHAGLVATLKRHCVEVAEHHGVSVRFDAGDGLDALSPEIALCLFRVAQEALNNAVRHGRPRHIVVHLRATAGHVELRVIDDGAGFVAETNGSGLGLRSIDERVRLTRGTMRVESTPGQGTTVQVEIPAG